MKIHSCKHFKVRSSHKVAHLLICPRYKYFDRTILTYMDDINDTYLLWSRHPCGNQNKCPLSCISSGHICYHTVQASPGQHLQQVSKHQGNWVVMHGRLGHFEMAYYTSNRLKSWLLIIGLNLIFSTSKAITSCIICRSTEDHCAVHCVCKSGLPIW